MMKEDEKEHMLPIWLFVSVLLLSSCQLNEPINKKEEQTQTATYNHQRKESLQIKSPTNQSSDIGWTLVFNDNFEDTGSLKNWSLQDWPAEKNNEWQYYSPENVKVQDGMLVIKSKQEMFRGRKYTSGALTTENTFEFTYGKVEIKAKIPKGKAVFPAFWLVNFHNGSWLPEIDIMENLGQKPNELYFVVHWENDRGEKMRDFFHYKSQEDFSKEFHVFGLTWEKDRIVWELDGKQVFETKRFSPASPLYLYLNTAIGGDWPGSPDPSEAYPKEMLVDYVKVYQQTKGE